MKPKQRISYRDNEFSLSLRNQGGVKGWVIEEIALHHPDTLSLPKSHENLFVLGMDLQGGEAYPQVKKLILPESLVFLELFDLCFPSLEEICEEGEEGLGSSQNSFQAPFPGSTKNAPKESLRDAILARPHRSFQVRGFDLYSQEGRLLYWLKERGERVLGEGLCSNGEEGSQKGKEPSFSEELSIKKDTLLAVKGPADTLILPEQVKKISPQAFARHAPRRLESFHLLESTGEKAFYEFPGAGQVRELVIHNPGEHILGEKLLPWPGLERVHLPQGAGELSSRDGILYGQGGRSLAFFPPCHPLPQGCFSIPEGVEKIEERAFAYGRLKKVVMPPSVKSVGRDAFLKCKSLTSVWMSDSIKELYGSGIHARYVYTAGVFGGCESLSFVHLPQGLKRLGANAFFQSGLPGIELPEGLEEIGVRAFYQTPMERVSLPPSLLRVGKEAFLGPIRQIQAYEGTAKGLLLSVSAGKNQRVDIRIHYLQDPLSCDYLPVPVNYRGSLTDLLTRVWDGDRVDWEAYAQCIPGEKDPLLRLQMSFVAALHLDKKGAAPLKKNLSGKSLQLGQLLIEEEKIQVFSRYLDFCRPPRKVLDELLLLCNRQGKQSFIPYLLEKNQGRGHLEEYSL